MINIYNLYLILLAGGLSLLVHFLVIDVTHKKGIFMDKFEKIQKAHTLPTPRIGGLGVFLACMIIINDTTLGISLMLAAIPAFIAGFLEDYSGRVAPLQRLAIMLLSPIICSIFLSQSVITHIYNIDIPYMVSITFTILLSLAMVNGVNFIDGQNGLASGSVILSQIGILAVAIALNDYSIAFVSATIIVSTLTFLYFNFPVAKIFLGDGGAYFLGFITAILSICLYTQHIQDVSFLLIPTLLIYPLFEVLFSVIRKLFFDKISPLQSDKYHLHQLLFRNQAHHKHHLPSMFILPLQLCVSIVAILYPHKDWVLMLAMLAFVSVYTALYIYTKRLDMIKRAHLLNKTILK
jgi:UDP-N-acetylmuramyl pentapeptide phosphotransferase/UDP-N-acetylglucosamine-1-phosphate transferase